MRNQRRVVALFSALASLWAWHPLTAFAQVESAMVKVDGLACPFCAYGLEKKLGKVKGITKTSTDLKAGLVNLNLEKSATISQRALAKAVREAGFTPGTITITATGTLKEASDQFLLSVGESHQTFLLFEVAPREKHSHKSGKQRVLSDVTAAALRKLEQDATIVVVTGAIHDHEKGPASLRIDHYEARP